MRKLGTITFFLAMLVAGSAKAESCIATDGKEKLTAFWGHGEAWVYLPGSTEPLIEGPLKWDNIGSSITRIIISDGKSKLTLLRSILGKPVNSDTPVAGILEVNGTEEFFDCKL